MRAAGTRGTTRRHVGQIVDTSLVAAPRQRNTEAEKQVIKKGRVPEEWKANPAKLAGSKPKGLKRAIARSSPSAHKRGNDFSKLYPGLCQSLPSHSGFLEEPYYSHWP